MPLFITDKTIIQQFFGVHNHVIRYDMKNKINKEGQRSVNATPTRYSDTGPPARISTGSKLKQERAEGKARTG
jgi:rRNA maturation protein Nop10